MTDKTAASFASGEPALSDTKEESERTPRSLPSSWMNLYNHIHAMT